MERLSRLALAVACGLLSLAAHAADPLPRAKDLVQVFLAGNMQSLWSEMTPQMQQALGSADALLAVRGDLARQYGIETEVVSERTFRQDGHDVYERIARWSGSATPLQTIVALDDEGRIAGFFVRPQPVAAESSHLDYQTKTRLRLPFDGAWHVVWGGRTIEDNYHAADAGQRFAIDLLVLQDGRSHTGDPKVLHNYHCWDRPILAPADGVVAQVESRMPDQPIGRADAAHPLGNHVVLDFGNGEYGFLAHLRQGSVKVAQGDTVNAGTELGRCGNSGNTTEPHLHFHLQDTPRLGQGQGLPARFVNYRVDGERVETSELTKGQTVEPLD